MTSPAGRRLLPAAVRRPAAVVVALCAALALGLALAYAGGDGYTGLDARIIAGLPYPWQHLTALNTVADLAPPLLLLLDVVLVAVCAARRDGRLAALIALGPGLSMLVTEAAKPLVGRTIQGWFALPSGHTAGATSVSLALAFVLLHGVRRHPVAAWAAALGGVTLVALAIGTVMVLLRSHYPTDIAAGWAVGIACTAGAALALDRAAGASLRRTAGQPARRPSAR